MSISSISHESCIINAIINAADDWSIQISSLVTTIDLAILDLLRSLFSALILTHTQLFFFYTDKTLYDDEQLDLVSSQEWN